MSDGPITRDDEMDRLRTVAGDEEQFKLTMLLHVQESRIWRKNFTEATEKRFTAIENTIYGNGGVKSSINDYEENKQQFIGMRKLVVGAVAVVAAIGGGIIGLYEIIKLMSEKP